MIKVAILVAAPVEARAVMGRQASTVEQLRPGWVLIQSGVGKANAAAAVATLNPLPDLLLNLGICGTLDPAIPLGTAIAADRSLYADEGILTPDGFLTPEQFGFPYAPPPFSDRGIEPPHWALAPLRALADRVAPIATVSTCAGTDQRAAWVRSRTGAIAEAMEGAAAGQICAKRGIAFAELRVVSNTAGDRQHQRWDVPAACTRLAEIARALQGIDLRR
jgi:futalosine hydrolase